MVTPISLADPGAEYLLRAKSVGSGRSSGSAHGITDHMSILDQIMDCRGATYEAFIESEASWSKPPLISNNLLVNKIIHNMTKFMCLCVGLCLFVLLGEFLIEFKDAALATVMTICLWPWLQVMMDTYVEPKRFPGRWPRLFHYFVYGYYRKHGTRNGSTRPLVVIPVMWVVLVLSRCDYLWYPLMMLWYSSYEVASAMRQPEVRVHCAV